MERQLFQIRHSPNTLKARIGLGFKGLAFEAIEVDPRDREGLRELSGQPLTPVLRDGRTIVFDSASILRYLDANYRDTPPLYGGRRAFMREIEQWEWWARRELSEPTVKIFGVLLGKLPEDQRAAACEEIHRLSARIEERLAAGPWLMGDRLTAADAMTAPFVFAAMLPAAVAATRPVWREFHAHLHLGEGRERTRDWCTRVMQFEGALDEVD